MLFKNIVNNILAESQESESIKQAKKLVMNKLNVSPDKADKIVRIDIRETFPILRSKKGGKFILGVTRISVNNELKDGSDISKLNRIIDIIINGHYEDYDRNLNNMSKEELFMRFSSEDRALSKAQRDEVNNLAITSNTDYNIVKIDSFDEATNYNKFMYKKDPWCITYSEDNYNAYTANETNQIYFCLKNGFDKIKPIIGENCPLDDYGLSMISVIVDDEGNLLYSTTRWNHSNGGNDNALNASQISKIMNVNFFDTFKPNEKFKNTVKEIEQRLANKQSIKESVDVIISKVENVLYITVGDKDNVVYKNKIISD